MEKLSESAISWLDDELTKGSTNTPEIVIEEETAVGTLVVIIISAIASVVLLFVMAIFIDCRHQKLAKNRQNKLKSTRKIIKISVPAFKGRSNQEVDDRCTFADKMYTQDSTPSSVAVIV